MMLSKDVTEWSTEAVTVDNFKTKVFLKCLLSPFNSFQ